MRLIIYHLNLQSISVRTSGTIWIDFNPTSEFWAHKEVLVEPDSEFVILTYKDNEALPSTIIEEIERAKKKATTSTYWSNWWQVYGLGQVGSLEGVCITDWKELNTLPEEARLLCGGLDWGYSNDPTSYIRLYKWNNAYIFDEVFYQKGLLNSEISNLLKSHESTELIYADSAEPKSIAELNSYGHTLLPVSKGRDSIVYGINLINQNEVYVTARSKNLINELRNYIWLKDKEGNKLNKPIDAWNHCFVGGTLITTDKGSVKMADIKENDLVLTSEGYKRVLAKFDNGIKQVSSYSMQFGTIIVQIDCTVNHKFKADSKWTQVSKLKKGCQMYLHKHLKEKNTTYIQMRDISLRQKRLHRVVWQHHKGEIPKGYHIHHVDGIPKQ